MKSPIVINPSAGTAAASAFAGVLFVVLVALATGIVRRFLEGEDGFVENVSAVAYAIGAVVAVLVARETSGWHRAHWFMWAVLSFVFFGEETSWLQHWFGYATPENVKAINVQSEFNLHNLKVVSPDDRVFSGEGVAFSWRHLLSAQHIFNLGFITYFLLVPLLMMSDGIRVFAQAYGFPELRPRFVLMMWTPIVVSVGFTIANRSRDGSKSLIAETREMFFALAVLWFVAAAYRYVRAQKKSGVARGAAAGAPARAQPADA